jgi:hypothetical protein
LHENLGISVMEAVLTGAVPVVPDRCSYAEMYLPEFKYPSVWTSCKAEFDEHRQDMVDFIQDKIDNYDSYAELIKQQQQILIDDYLNSSIMVNKILNINN